MLAGGLIGMLGMLTVTGCETGRVNKLHAQFESVSDITTVPHRDPQDASIGTGIAPVPGSPTSADANGLQPVDDNLARKGPGSEKGIPMWPRMQPQDTFLHQ
jgi:hypothetical protein